MAEQHVQRPTRCCCSMRGPQAKEGAGGQGDWSPAAPSQVFRGEKLLSELSTLNIRDFTCYRKSVCFVFVVKSSGMRDLHLKLTS